jgi:hypothetical protein
MDKITLLDISFDKHGVLISSNWFQFWLSPSMLLLGSAISTFVFSYKMWRRYR